MYKFNSKLIAISIFSLLLTTVSFSRSFRVSQIPNGSVNGCANCHVNPAGGGTRNAFGKLVEQKFLSVPGSSGQVLWEPALASYDSDGDGISNGDELLDPFGEWGSGQQDPGNSSLVSIPGIASSKVIFNATLQITGMTPHLNKKFELRVVDKSNRKEVFRYKDESIANADFNVQLQNIQAGHSYWIDFYSDHNGNGKYDAPPVDHAWRLELNNTAGGEIIPFAHNTNFTDIKWKYLLTINFTGMTPYIGQLMEIRVEDDSTKTEVGRTRIENVESDNFTLEMPFLLNGRKNYRIQFYADFNKNGLYDAPPTDHAYEIHLINNAADTVLNFSHNTDFSDINWKYLFTLNLSEMTPHISELIGARLLNSSDESEVSKLSLFTIPAANFSTSLAGIELNHDYHFDFFADHNGDGMYQDPPTDHAWKINFSSGNAGNVVLNFLHNTNFSNITWPYNTTGVEREDEILPAVYSLKQNFPNPFNPATQIQFNIKETGFVTIKVYDILGKEVATLVNQILPSGNYTAEWNAQNFESGIYLYRIHSGNYTETKKMLLVK